VLFAAEPGLLATERIDPAGPGVPLHEARLLAPIDAQEVWGAGVTYQRSKEARQQESEGGGSFYDQVYRADRPELFFKATPGRVVGPGGAVRVRRDSRWTVPEPELALVLAPDLRLVGFTIGNDMSARDIEGAIRSTCRRRRSTTRAAPWVLSSPWPPRCPRPTRSGSG
jgi:2-dehydro-3-deoxy-D-arabinonate dehydratase